MRAQTMSTSHGSGCGGGGALSRQGSVCSFELSTEETQLGAPLHGVNIDDLLCTVLPAISAAEPSAAMAGKRSADEVWRDIQSTSCSWRPAIGEMTLEDFLSRGGASADASGSCSGAHWLRQYQPPPRTLAAGAGPVLDSVCHDGHRGVEVLSHRAADGGPVEKTVDRRRKRMIKNRESAARSRARKQAYKNELENKISLLQEENEQIRRQKALEPLVHYVPRQEPRRKLRRTNSATF